MHQLIDDFMPDFHWHERHETLVRASADRVEAAARQVSLRDLPLTRLLMTIRTVLEPRRQSPDRPLLDLMTHEGFAVLADEPGRELVLGAAGRPWQIRGDGLDPLDGPDAFRAYDRPNAIRATMNFAIDGDGDGDATRLVTETRIEATDDDARRTFGRYWRVIMPGSALIRRDMLRGIARRAREPR